MAKWLSCAESTYLYGAFDYILLSSPCMFHSEPTLYAFLNVKKFCARNRCDIWSLSDSNGIWTHNHLVPKQTLNHLAKLSKWLSYVVSTYLYGAFVVIMNLVFQTVCKLIQRYVLFAGGIWKSYLLKGKENIQISRTLMLRSFSKVNG